MKSYVIIAVLFFIGGIACGLIWSGRATDNLRSENDFVKRNLCAVQSNLINAQNSVSNLTEQYNRTIGITIQLSNSGTISLRYASNAGAGIGAAIITADQLDALLERGQQLTR